MTTPQPPTGASPWIQVITRPLRDSVGLMLRTPAYARPALVRRWLASVFHNSSSLPNDLPCQPRILFVCHGNILRSAVAEALASSLANDGLFPPGLTFASAGTHAVDGKPADPRGIAVAPELGVSLQSHRARRLTEHHVASADLIVAMDIINDAEIAARFPAASSKIRLLGDFGPGPRQIPDPYTGNAETVRYRFYQIARNLEGLALLLKPPGDLRTISGR